MNNEWDEYAEGWDTDPAVKKYANKAYIELTNIIELNNQHVLDFGCGTGALTELISPHVKTIVAIDPSKEMIKFLDNKSLENVNTVADYLTEELVHTHSALTNQFDLIVASSVCGFLPSYEETLSLLNTLLKPGGMFIQWDWLAESDDAGMGMSESRVMNAFKSHQFNNIQVTHPFIMESSKGKMTVLMAIGKRT